MRHCRSPQRTQDAYVWATVFSLGPPKCQARRYSFSNHPQRRLLTVLYDLRPSEVPQTQAKYCRQLWALPGCQPKAPFALVIRAFLPAGMPPPHHNHHTHLPETEFSSLQRDGLCPPCGRRQANATRNREGYEGKMAAAQTAPPRALKPGRVPTARNPNALFTTRWSWERAPWARPADDTLGRLHNPCG